ncbi:8493_t:CDS:2 [Entrophospora sp. SA101]|nr:8493_t:CDS:2 [Entrophospora sp. SA101]
MNNIIKISLNKQDDHSALMDILGHVKGSKKCVVIAGAGISCSGGIPDFRSANGLYEMVKQRFPRSFSSGQDLFDACLLRNDESIRAFYLFMGMLKEYIIKANPTPTHLFLKKLSDVGKLVRVYTQNIDNLEEVVGLQTISNIKATTKCSAKVIQLHGTMKSLKCDACSNIVGFESVHCNTLKKGAAPSCPSCEKRETERREQKKRYHRVGELKPTVVLYGDHHPHGLEIGQIAAKDKQKADCLIVMGTSLKVIGVKKLVKGFARGIHERGGKVIIVNVTDVTRSKEWNDIIDYQVEGTTDEWVSLLEKELDLSKLIDKIAGNQNFLKRPSYLHMISFYF